MLPDILALAEQLDHAERDARVLVTGLDENLGGWRAGPGSWSVAECLDHLATGNRVYLEAMNESAVRARRDGRLRRGPAAPGFVGRTFVRMLEPPVNPWLKLKAPRKIVPRSAPALADSFADFIASQEGMRAFLRTYADLDLSGVAFKNPFIKGVRFSLATGLNVIAAHERRHLWQAWRVRRDAERAAGSG